MYIYLSIMNNSRFVMDIFLSIINNFHFEVKKIKQYKNVKDITITNTFTTNITMRQTCYPTNPYPTRISWSILINAYENYVIYKGIFKVSRRGEKPFLIHLNVGKKNYALFKGDNSRTRESSPLDKIQENQYCIQRVC